MAVTYPLIREACFELVRTTKGTIKPIKMEDIGLEISEIGLLSDKFYEETIQYMDHYGEWGITENLLALAVHYISSVHTIPVGDIFENYKVTLPIILEIALPNAGVSKGTPAYEFLDFLIEGLESHKEE